MVVVIISITFIALIILCTGFFGIKIPFVSIPKLEYQKYKFRVGPYRHEKKIMRKRIWHHEIHKGFIELLS
jgi:hypothetical protein